MSIDTNYIITTKVRIRDEEYELPNKLEVEDRLRKLVKELIKRIKLKLGNSTDFYFKYAYTNADILNNIVKPEDSDRGGSHRNGIIYVGKVGFNGGAMGSDEDVMATIFHEFMHYIVFKNNVYPVRYEDREEGLIWSENVSVGESLQTDEEFREDQYQLFLLSKGNEVENYPFVNTNLSNQQKVEFEKYIQEKGLKPDITEKRYQYTPSNYALDEINAHSKTLEANKMKLFNMSQAKVVLYDNEIARYKSKYTTCIEIEEQYGYTTQGYKK